MSDETTKKRHATTADLKRIIRKRLRRRPEHEHQELNIYAMMDMMTILLVFLIMQFAATSANIVQSAELQLPMSTSTREARPAIVVTIARNNILVEGRPVMSLRNSIVDPGQKQGGANGFLILPLHEELNKHRDRLKLIEARNPRRPFTGDVQIVADKRIPYRTLIETVYTCGQSEFKNVRFVVLQTSQERAGGLGDPRRMRDQAR
jgi:biopolymer transport protein ExbD